MNNIEHIVVAKTPGGKRKKTNKGRKDKNRNQKLSNSHATGE